MHRLLLLGLLFVATPVFAQDAITPGNPEVDNAKIETGEMAYSITVRQGTMEQPFGTVATSRTVDTDAERITEIRTYEMMGQKFADTTVAVWPSLASISHYSSSPQRTLRYAVEDGMISGTRALPGGEPETFEMSVDGPVFDSSWMSTLASALPLVDGYETTVSAFQDDEDGLGVYALSASGPTDIELPNGAKYVVWEIAATNPAGETVKFYVDIDNHKLLRIIMAPQPGVEVLIDAELPLSGK